MGILEKTVRTIATATHAYLLNMHFSHHHHHRTRDNIQEITLRKSVVTMSKVVAKRLNMSWGFPNKVRPPQISPPSERSRVPSVSRLCRMPSASMLRVYTGKWVIEMHTCAAPKFTCLAGEIRADRGSDRAVYERGGVGGGESSLMYVWVLQAGGPITSPRLTHL